MKFEQNVLRDRRVIRSLRRMGWTVAIVWECETARGASIERKLDRMLDRKTVA
jgi:G:T-mismatch repair DNA endonuclease (very short patch repair protein)